MKIVDKRKVTQIAGRSPLLVLGSWQGEKCRVSSDSSFHQELESHPHETSVATENYNNLDD